MYKIMLNGEQVGHAQVEREGLYYRFNCTCALKDNKLYRIVVGDGKTKIKLGVCVPDGQSFVLSTKIPVKYLQGNSFCFLMEAVCGNAIAVSTGQPFFYLDKLQTARLQIADGQPSIIIN